MNGQSLKEKNEEKVKMKNKETKTETPSAKKRFTKDKNPMGTAFDVTDALAKKGKPAPKKQA